MGSMDHLPSLLVKVWEGLLELEERSNQSIREKKSVSRRKIHGIPQHMAENVEFKRFYEPRIISLSRFHREKMQRLPGDWRKGQWAARYIKDTNRKVEDLYKNMYEENNIGDPARLNLMWRNICCEADDNEAAEDVVLKLIVDGFSVLQLLEKSDNTVDPEKELNISINSLVGVHQDLLIMDNQIPFRVLRVLCNDDQRLQKCLHNFLQVHGIERGPEIARKKKENQEGERDYEEEPVHLLDYLRRALLMRDRDTFFMDMNSKIERRSLHLRKYRIGSIRELKAAGIRVRRHSNINSFYPSFNNGILHLPELTVDGSTAHIFLNLIAYEMCPAFHNNFEITSFIVFMSSLIDLPEDVKELISAGIIINQLVNDKQVADLFNKLDSVLVPETPLFAHIRDQIRIHFDSKRGKVKILTWMGEAYNTFFRSPWTIIALLAATLGLVLTFIQTWFAIHPKAS